MTTDKKPSRHPEQRTTWPHQANAPYFIYSRQQHINTDNMMLLTPEVNSTHLTLSSCPHPPRGRPSGLSHFRFMETISDCDQMFPEFPFLYTSQSNGHLRTSNTDSTICEMVLKPRPMYRSTWFARLSTPSLFPGRR